MLIQWTGTVTPPPHRRPCRPYTPIEAIEATRLPAITLHHKFRMPVIEFELQVHLINQCTMTAVLQMLFASATGIAITHPVAHRPLQRPRAAVPSLSSDVDTRKNVGLYSGLEEPVGSPVHDIASVRGASSLAVERPPEVLAPAGGWAQARAAVVSGADSIYFGVRGLNARVRAENFAIEEVPELMEYLHSHGVKGFCAVNVLTFDEELRMSEQLVKDLAAGAPASSLPPSSLPRRRNCRPAADEPRLPPLTRPLATPPRHEQRRSTRSSCRTRRS